MSKAALFVFNGDPMCFIHVLLNALDLNQKGEESRIVVEGAATKLVPALAEPTHPLHGLWNKVKAAGLVDGVCRACSEKMGTRKAAEDQNLPLLEDMNGHPAMAAYRKAGWQIITF
ncbi:MAG: cytoplasmic protein [Desulfobacterales bacterium]|jgi:hypothetical protein